MQDQGQYLQFAWSSEDLGHRSNGHKVQLEQVIPVTDEGRDANLQRGVDGCGCVGRPTNAHTRFVL